VPRKIIPENTYARRDGLSSLHEAFRQAFSGKDASKGMSGAKTKRVL
jgi:hypothetical protein